MARLIDADALVKALNESGVPYRADVQEVLDAQPCVGDCDHCSFDSTWCEKCKFYVEDGFCGHPLLDKELNGGCEWHEPIEGESL